MTDLPTLLAELDALVGKMTPGPWTRTAPTIPFHMPREDDVVGVIALVNAWPALKRWVGLILAFDHDMHVENERLRTLVAQQREALRALMDNPGDLSARVKARAVLAQEVPGAAD